MPVTKITILFLQLIMPFYLAAASFTATRNGNWNASSTWAEGSAPTNNSTIVIPSSFTVTVNFNSPTYASVDVQVNGTLSFNNGDKLNVDCDSRVTLSSGGSLTGGTPGSKINVCGSTVWNGGSTTSGPISWGNAPLPVTLLAFTAEAYANNVICKWTTASETNNDYFAMQRSTDFNKIEQLGIVDGSGNSNQILHYSYVDISPLKNTHYYRLMQVDYNGDKSFYEWAAVNGYPKASGVSFYPNPVQSVLICELKAELKGEIKISALSILKGKTVISQLFNADGRNKKIEIDISQLSNGLYYFSIETENNHCDALKTNGAFVEVSH